MMSLSSQPIDSRLTQAFLLVLPVPSRVCVSHSPSQWCVFPPSRHRGRSGLRCLTRPRGSPKLSYHQCGGKRPTCTTTNPLQLHTVLLVCSFFCLFFFTKGRARDASSAPLLPHRAQPFLGEAKLLVAACRSSPFPLTCAPESVSGHRCGLTPPSATVLCLLPSAIAADAPKLSREGICNIEKKQGEKITILFVNLFSVFETFVVAASPSLYSHHDSSLEGQICT